MLMYFIIILAALMLELTFYNGLYMLPVWNFGHWTLLIANDCNYI